MAKNVVFAENCEYPFGNYDHRQVKLTQEIIYELFCRPGYETQIKKYINNSTNHQKVNNLP